MLALLVELTVILLLIATEELLLESAPVLEFEASAAKAELVRNRLARQEAPTTPIFVQMFFIFTSLP
jgi:hypothetical protein